jgi:hypothetical protein
VLDAPPGTLGADDVAPGCFSAPLGGDCAMAWLTPNINAAVAAPAIKYFRMGLLLLKGQLSPIA